MPSSERNYYVVCDDNCRFPSMTSEQILEAIAEATGETPVHIDDAFISKLKEQNRNGQIKLWVGTNAEYNDIDTPESDVVYLITDSSEYDDLESAISGVSQRLDGDETRLDDAETRLDVAESRLTSDETRLNDAERKIREDATVYKSFTAHTTQSSTQEKIPFLSTLSDRSEYNITKTFSGESLQKGLSFAIAVKPDASIVGKKYFARYLFRIRKNDGWTFYEKVGCISGEVLNIVQQSDGRMREFDWFKEGVFSPSFLGNGNFTITVDVVIFYESNPTNLDCWDINLRTSRITED